MTVTDADKAEKIATCTHCGKLFVPARSDAKFCGASCRQAAHRARLDADQPKRRRRPLPDSFRDASLDLDRLVRRVDRLVNDDRFPKSRADLSRYGHAFSTYADRLTEAADRFEAPRAKPKRSGPRQKHLEMLDAAAAVLGGCRIGLDEMQVLDSSVAPEDAQRLALELWSALQSVGRIESLLRARAREQ